MQAGQDGLVFNHEPAPSALTAGALSRGHVMANRKDRRKSAAVRRSSGTMSPKEKRQLIIGGLVVAGVVIAVLALFMWPR